MISLVLTNRNRDLRIVNNCLQSLNKQTYLDFKTTLVDYGSDEVYKLQLKELLEQFVEVNYIDCPVQGQLWNKCRAINIALRQTTTPYFIVGDIDLIFAPTFIEKASELAKPDEVHYFQYAFLAYENSLVNKAYDEYLIDFLGNKEVTGTTLFPTEPLIALHGYDEFYHGWGAEDTDIHIRLQIAGLDISFYDQDILVKHQWHPKQYRSKNSSQPFHSDLERINHQYMMAGKRTNRTIVNSRHQWGIVPDKERYFQLVEQSSNILEISNSKNAVNAILFQFQNFKDEVFTFEIKKASKMITFKNKLKQLLRKKHIVYLEMEEVNNMILEEIIKNYRNNSYSYSFDRKANCIKIKMFFL